MPLLQRTFLRTAKLWEVATIREVGTLKGHLRSIHALDISPDGDQGKRGSGGSTKHDDA